MFNIIYDVIVDVEHKWLLDNSQIRQLADCQLADWTTREVDISRTPPATLRA